MKVSSCVQYFTKFSDYFSTSDVFIVATRRHIMNYTNLFDNANNDTTKTTTKMI